MLLHIIHWVQDSWVGRWPNFAGAADQLEFRLSFDEFRGFTTNEVRSLSNILVPIFGMSRLVDQHFQGSFRDMNICHEFIGMYQTNMDLAEGEEISIGGHREDCPAP